MSDRGPLLCLLGALFACGGGGTATAPSAPGEGTSEPTETADPGGGELEADDAPAKAAADTPGCRSAYDEYVRAWNAWFTTAIEDAETRAAVLAAFEDELPNRSALAEMRVTAEDLRYEPGFELWIRALTATEHAIDGCGEGVARPAT